MICATLGCYEHLQPLLSIIVLIFNLSWGYALYLVDSYILHWVNVLIAPSLTYLVASQKVSSRSLPL
jgi:hypothetical protein